MCGGGGSAPAPDPLVGQAALENAKLSKEALAWYKDVYTNELLPMQREQNAMNRQLIDRYLANMDKQEKFAEEQNAYYEKTFKPIEERMARDAMEYDSEGNIQRRSGIAAANVEQQFSNAQQETARNLSRYGLNPNSSAFAATNERLMRESALGRAGAATGAAFDTMDRGIALRAGAANFGRNMPNTASNFYSNANASGANATNASATNMNSAIQAGSFGGQGFNTAIAGNQSAGNLMLGEFNGRMQAYQADQQARGGMFSGLGQRAGLGIKAYASNPAAFAGLADGGTVHEGHGAVRGPGGPVDDKIPAMLSNGEYVVPADVVRAKGLEFFEKLKDKYHTPAAIQRRQAIQRG
jgi:hypothetical protein